MPTYEYECQKCGKHFEYFQSMSEPRKTTCEACGGALERLISPSGFILKGGGWYKDLYSSSKKPDSKPAADKPASDSGSSTASTPKTDKADKATTKKE
jgi:putative FmdB family regulatory protein